MTVLRRLWLNRQLFCTGFQSCSLYQNNLLLKRHKSRMEGVEKLKDLFEDIAQISVPTLGRIITKRPDTKTFVVNSTWSNHAVQMKKSAVKDRTAFIEETEKELRVVSETTSRLTCFENQSSFYNKTDTKLATLLNVTDGKDKKQFITVYDLTEHCQVCCVEMSAKKDHGKIHISDTTGGLVWSNGDGHLLYVAERYAKKKEYFDAELEWSNEEKMAESRVGEKYTYRDSWGEKLAEVIDPVLCIMDIPSGNVTVLEAIPKTVSPMQPLWSPNDEGVVFVGCDNNPFKLGKVACFNRSGAIYYHELQSVKSTILSEVNMAVDGPRFSPDDRQLIFLQRPVGGAHLGCQQLVKIDWTERNAKVLVDIVHTPEETGAFPGLYVVSNAKRCWAADNTRLLIGSIWGSKSEIIVIDSNNGAITRLTNTGNVHGSWKLLDVNEDLVLASVSAPNRPPHLLIGKLPPSGKEQQIIWTRIGDSVAAEKRDLLNFKWQILAFRRDHPNCPDQQYEAILIVPESGERLPLVVNPHGGPHSTCLAAWPLMDHLLMLNAGYALLRVNYRGSLGFGNDFVNCLPSNCGSLDVKDVQHAVEVVLDSESRLDPNKVVLWGASHGGFLSAHLVGQYPDFYKACALLNPVLNCLTMFDLTDIPDWTVFEASKEVWEPRNRLSEGQIKDMYEKSPVAHAHKVKSAVLLLIGRKDLRVSPHYMGFYRTLKARDVPCEVLEYPESNHGISEVECAADFSINVVRWFEKYLPN